MPPRDAEFLQAPPQRLVLRRGGLRERPGAQLEVGRGPAAGLGAQRGGEGGGAVGLVDRACPGPGAGQRRRAGAAAEPSVLEDPVRQPRVAERLDRETDDADVRAGDQELHFAAPLQHTSSRCNRGRGS